ncbi:CRISPR-associated protein Cas1 [Spiroplasma syrphidicola EA-1]|uniref:CRISPR-associated protein Cas1 n=1 Tax=Spiroplasma syrphidicola EA-1 TaxID=1276229 RepID=R4UK48_9MOLU|nr:type II CRISPR-associated endonuclease Cas1 [Spiroplasma syrphidicola]AGM26525.1 CRISPR-associated protein Cas1 [Spiroplasma syrphidicola EA-1]
MSWRTLIINKSKKINVKNNNICVTDSEGKEILFAFTEINSIIFENNYTLVSCNLLAKICQYNIFAVFCDEIYEPRGLLLSMSNHFQPYAVLNMQLKITADLKEKLWKEIIKKKIWNSSIVLENVTDFFEVVLILQKYSNEVINGDLTNREGLSAKVFFRTLYGSAFIRQTDDLINSALNYGYKILVSCISRTLVKYGLILHLGIHHIGKTNPYNLSYDFIEPLRPLVDYWVTKNLYTLDGKLTYNQRISLIKLLDEKVEIDGRIMNVNNAINYMIKSFISCLKDQDENLLKLPSLLLKDSNNNDEEELNSEGE